jgi:hypothetical protein
VVLVHVDEAGQHDCAAGIDHLVERVGLGRLRRRADRRNEGAVDRHIPIRKDIAPGIDGDDVAVGDQCAGHSLDPSGAQLSSVPARKHGIKCNLDADRRPQGGRTILFAQRGSHAISPQHWARGSGS